MFVGRNTQTSTMAFFRFLSIELFRFKVLWISLKYKIYDNTEYLGKHLSTCPHLHVGIAQIALKRAPWGTFFQAQFYPFLPFLPFFTLFTIFSLNKFPKPSGQGFRPPQNQANAPLNLENSSLKKCPKPSGQGFRPPPPKRAMPK